MFQSVIGKVLMSVLVLLLLASFAVSRGWAAIGGCQMFPANNIWNTRIDKLPVDARSATYINSIGAVTGLHPDFGANWNGGPFGIPYMTVPGTQPKVPVSFYWPDESDPGPYPIPSNVPVENGSDAHVLVVDRDHCVLYEMFDSAYNPTANTWSAGSGAVFDLHSNHLRPATWTSADAAGLPILAGLARYDEVASGAINHALRFTVHSSQRGYVWPARHDAPYNSTSNSPTMGMRARLKSTFNTAAFPPQAKVILEALKTYGMIIADNGSNWYISGAPDSRWDDNDLNSLKGIAGSNFEFVNESGLQMFPDSGEARQGANLLALPLLMR